MTSTISEIITSSMAFNSTSSSSSTISTTTTSTNTSIPTTILLNSKVTSPASTTTMKPLTTLNYTENDELIGFIIFINFIFTCCLMVAVAYNRQVFCFSKPKTGRGGKKKKKAKGKGHIAEPWDDINDDEDDEDFEEI
ncbi:hypothetical protein L5515_008804 [Caenorhabditis briggsae]|uniref:Uncharacterized protein n=1 Tax=Caenorhabditis briggsae TaxID=6238 RepID=A0AAE9F9V3_CAEBR|nr:hypothetical protein L5515_008804 [Caenorhabditis briggsae]